MQCAMALRLSEIFWLYQPIVHDPLSQLSATIFPKPAGMRLATYIVVAHFGFLKPPARRSRSADLMGAAQSRPTSIILCSAVSNSRDGGGELLATISRSDTGIVLSAGDEGAQRCG